MDEFLVPGAYLQLAPVFLLAALLALLGIRRGASRRRSIRSARGDFDDPIVLDRSARPPR